jgi:adenylosuccinate lyase
MATENILMAAVKAGGDRQELHERIRQHSMEAGRQVKQEGRKNDLLDRIATDPVMRMSRDDIGRLLNVAEFIGRAPQQTREFIAGTVDPLLERASRYGTMHKAELTV